jgi:hypothetical protein
MPIALCAFVSWVSPAGAIVGGEPLKAEDWPSAVAFGTSSYHCSATAVGPQVLLTAAHCIDRTKDIQVAQTGGKRYQLDCEDLEPGMTGLSLCMADHPVFEAYEFIETKAGFAQEKHQVVMLGHGCRSRGGIDGQPEGLAIGRATIAAIAEGPAATLLIRTSGDALCFGDSGAGLFGYAQDPETHEIRRSLMGVGFQSDVIEISFFIATSTPGFAQRARAWALERNVEICGITQTRDKCTGSPAIGLPVTAAPETVTNSKTERLPLVTIPYVAGETIRTLITKSCGAVSQAYMNLLTASYEATSRKTLELDKRLDSAGTIALPLCAGMTGAPTYEARTVAPGDSLRKYYQWVLEEAAKRKQYAGWTSFCETSVTCPGPDIPETVIPNQQSGVFMEVFRALNPGITRLVAGDTILLPTVSAQGNAVAPTVPGGFSDVQPELSISEDELQSAVEDCVGGEGGQAYPYDISALLDVMMANKRLRQGKPVETKILIADSGLFSTGQSIFSEDALSDYDGIGFEALTKAILPKPAVGATKLSHGTQVASVALGWPLFAKMKAIEGTNIKLMIVRIFDILQINSIVDGKEVLGTRYQVYQSAFTDVQKAADREAFVVNLSLKTTTEIKEIEDLAKRGRHLIVVAAGNGGPGGGEDLNSGARFYPAQYGGGTYDSVITVAATQPNGAFAKFSNWSAQWVDIAAPGCRIPVLDYDLDRRTLRPALFSGTSLAAPLVSFTAALIKSESAGNWTPREVRQRILASADLVPALVKDDNGRFLVKHGRSLNPVKALSLYEDVLEIVDPTSAGGKAMIRGKVSFVKRDDGEIFRDDQRPGFTCDSDAVVVDPRVQEILKITPRFTKTNGTIVTKLYYLDPAGNFRDADCDEPKDFSLRIKDESEERSFPFEMIADFVRHSLPKQQ